MRSTLSRKVWGIPADNLRQCVLQNVGRYIDIAAVRLDLDGRYEQDRGQSMKR